MAPPVSWLFKSPVRHWWSRIWERFTVWVDTALHGTPAQQKARLKQNRARQYAMMKASRNAARNVPLNPASVVPQKR